MSLNVCTGFCFNEKVPTREHLFDYTFDLNQVIGRQINPRRQCRLTLVRKMHNFQRRPPRAFPFLPRREPISLLLGWAAFSG